MDKRIPISVFEDVAANFPAAIAVNGYDATLTYADLDLKGKIVVMLDPIPTSLPMLPKRISSRCISGRE